MSVIEVEAVVKRYGGTPVVDGVSFSVAEGEVFGILGPNGAGKTTTVEMVAGLRTRDAGTIRVLGMDPADSDPSLKEQLGVQVQAGRLPDRIEVAEAVGLYASFCRNPVPWHGLLDRLGLGDRQPPAPSLRQTRGG